MYVLMAFCLFGMITAHMESTSNRHQNDDFDIDSLGEERNKDLTLYLTYLLILMLIFSTKIIYNYLWNVIFFINPDFIFAVYFINIYITFTIYCTATHGHFDTD